LYLSSSSESPNFQISITYPDFSIEVLFLQEKENALPIKRAYQIDGLKIEPANNRMNLQILTRFPSYKEGKKLTHKATELMINLPC
jgi:hypothetical protein